MVSAFATTTDTGRQKWIFIMRYYCAYGKGQKANASGKAKPTEFIFKFLFDTNLNTTKTFREQPTEKTFFNFFISNVLFWNLLARYPALRIFFCSFWLLNPYNITRSSKLLALIQKIAKKARLEQCVFSQCDKVSAFSFLPPLTILCCRLSISYCWNMSIFDFEKTTTIFCTALQPNQLAHLFGIVKECASINNPKVISKM